MILRTISLSFFENYLHDAGMLLKSSLFLDGRNIFCRISDFLRNFEF